MNLKDRNALRRIGNGDIQAFEDLFHTYYPGMCSYAESLVKKQEVAEEITQDVFYNIWKNKGELKITISVQNYLYRSVFNNSMMHLRKIRKELSLDDQWAANTLRAEEQTTDGIDVRELNAIIVYTLQRLPARTQEIFNMSRFEGLKYQEIATRLSISIKTVEANMGKALKALRASLEDYRNTA
ncbi:MAG: RNA polymerase sigma-70 factor [Bacteroidales bacterium]|nr:RNA polymerase sigma-70 factor [Bacteroidales bacterium]